MPRTSRISRISGKGAQIAVIGLSDPQQQQPGFSSEGRRPRLFGLRVVLTPVVSALIGALIGAIVSVFAVVYQTNANQQQASANNLRAQRQAAYQSFLNESTYTSTQWYFYTSNRLSGSAQVSLYSALSQLQGDYYQIALAGPAAVSLQSYIVWADLQKMLGFLKAGERVPENSTTRADLNGYFNDMNKLITEMRQVIQGIKS